MAEISK